MQIGVSRGLFDDLEVYVTFIIVYMAKQTLIDFVNSWKKLLHVAISTRILVFQTLQKWQNTHLQILISKFYKLNRKFVFKMIHGVLPPGIFLDRVARAAGERGRVSADAVGDDPASRWRAPAHR